MKYLFIIIIAITACKKKDSSLEATFQIIATDKEMNDMASREGFHKALLVYADDNVIKPEEGENPVIGKPALIKSWSEKPDFKNLSWEPYKAEAAGSGDLGYSLGNWKMVTDDTTYYGNYYTIWKKQADGKWKFVVDGGNNTPAPTK
jgi:ketosteroid isomerase-like protein